MSSTPTGPVAGSYALRVTRRALRDIGLDPKTGATFDLASSRGFHPILDAFASKRANSPVGQEQTLGIRAPVYNLHARNPWRGVTWHDENENVVWLLGVTPHDYDEFVARAANGELTPTLQDYSDLEVARSVTPAALDESETLEAIAADGAALVESAFAAPNTEVSGRLASSLDVGVRVEVLVDLDEGGDVYLGFELPPQPGVATMPKSLVEVCIGLMLPDAKDEHLDWYYGSFPDRALKAGECVVRWRRPAP